VKRQQSPKSAVPVSTLSAAPDMPIAKPASVNNPLSPIAAVVGTNLLDQGIQKFAGFHNHDLKKGNEVVIKNQHILNRKLDKLFFISRQQLELEQKRIPDEFDYLRNL
jgi:hypothetical protein